jgi:hypothetical protein
MRAPNPTCCSDPRYLCDDCQLDALLQRNAELEDTDDDDEDEEFAGNSALALTFNSRRDGNRWPLQNLVDNALREQEETAEADAYDDTPTMNAAEMDAVRNLDMRPPAIACNSDPTDARGIDAFTGGRRDRGIPGRRIECPNCKGTGQVGHEMDRSKSKCETCGGTGTVTLRRQESAHDDRIPPYLTRDYGMR